MLDGKKVAKIFKMCHTFVIRKLKSPLLSCSDLKNENFKALHYNQFHREHTSPFNSEE